MRTNADYLAEAGLLGREMTDLEINDEQLEASIDFTDPRFTLGQELAEWASGFEIKRGVA